MFLSVLVLVVFFSSINVFSQSPADSTQFSTPRGQEVGADKDFMPISKSAKEDGYITVIEPNGFYWNIKKEDVVEEPGADKGYYVKVKRDDGIEGLIHKDKLKSANRVVVVPYLGKDFKYLVAAKDVKFDTKEGTKERFTFKEAVAACDEYSERKGGRDKGWWSVPDRIVLFGIYNVFKNEKDSVFKNAFISNFYWSSSKYDSFSASFVNFNYGSQSNFGDNNTCSVRCVRALL